MIAQIPLTPDQRVTLTSGSDWMQLTPEQNAFIQGTPPDHMCTLYGDTFLRVPLATYTELMGHAWFEASTSALRQLGLSHADEFVHESHRPELGQTFLRVTVTATDGRKATGHAFIPDPRAVH